MTTDDIRYIVGPINHGRDHFTRGQSNTDDGCGREFAALDDCIGELGGADHHRLDGPVIHTTGIQDFIEGVEHTIFDIGRCERLGRCEHRVAVDKDRIRVCTTDVDSDSHAFRSVVNFSRRV